MTRFLASDPKVELWQALSDLFLDTEVRWFLPTCAYQAIKIGLDADELDRTLTEEIAPAVCHNLLSVAGEWAGFELDWLLLQMEAARQHSWLRRQAVRPLQARYLTPLRTALRTLHQYLCLVPERALVDEATRLEALGHLYLEKDWSQSFNLWDCLGRLATSTWSEIEDSWRRGIALSFAPLLRSGAGNDPTIERCAENLAWLEALFTWLEERSLPTPAGVELGEQLSYAFLVDHLADSPRGNEVRDALAALDHPKTLLEAMISGPLDGLYQNKSRALSNLRETLTRSYPV